MDHYMVTAASQEEERNVLCGATTGRHDCRVVLDGSANDYNFTVHAVTHVNDSYIYHGNMATDCCELVLNDFKLEMESFITTGLPFPENVKVTEEKCGLINVTWKVSVQHI